MLDAAQHIHSQIIDWRRTFHQNPELGFEEHKTAETLIAILQSLEVESVQTGIAKTGIVVSIGAGTPAIGIRADMDALPVLEMNDVPYASQVEGKMHACGHDTHMAMALGVVKVLSQMADRPPGEIRFLFQPSEEKGDEQGKSGAIYMVEEGALDGLDAVIALHIDSRLDAGTITIEDGFVSAAVDTFYATIKGKGGHGAYPHNTVDPTFILAQVINAVQGIRARRINPVRPSVISVGYINGGNATNVIPDTIELGGTIRSFDEETRKQLWHELEQAFSISQTLGGSYDLRVVPGVPAVYNNPSVASVMRDVAAEFIGPDNIQRKEVGMGAEDFSVMAQKVPGAMFNLGAKYDDVDRPHHNPNFLVDESSFPLGTAILAETAVRLLKQFA